MSALRPLVWLAATTSIVAAMSGCESCKDKPRVDGPSSASPSGTLVPDAAMLNVATVPDRDVKEMLNPENLPLYAGPTGSIEGTINVAGPPAASSGLDKSAFKKCPAAEAEYGVMFRSGPFPDKGENERFLADAIVVVTGYSGYWVKAKDEAVEVAIEGCGYQQRAVAMTFGQRLEVKNLTDEFWVPELIPKSPGAMMMAPPHAKDPIRLYPKAAGRHALVDHDRKYIVNDLMVFRHPLHAVTDAKSGHYRIDGVPVGKLRVTASHMEIPGVAASVETDVTANQASVVNLTVNYRPSAAPKDAGVSDALPPYPGLH